MIVSACTLALKGGQRNRRSRDGVQILEPCCPVTLVKMVSFSFSELRLRVVEQGIQNCVANSNWS